MMALWKKMAFPPLPKKKKKKKKKKVLPKQKVPKKFEIFPAPSYKTRKQKLAPQWGVYTMENKDTNTDYEKVVWGPKLRNCRNYNQYHFLA